jgi:hypothetical protein
LIQTPSVDVEDELSWDPDLDAIDIGVTVHNGVVTLGGFVGSYMLRSRRRSAWPASWVWLTTSKCGCRWSTSGRTRK